jgi:hypothetical protein
MADETTPADDRPAETRHNEHVKAFFLDLAAKGKDAWNAWRRDTANKHVHVTFQGIDFSIAPNYQINFAGFDFGDGANFSGCKWRDSTPQDFILGFACFNLATFGDRTDFTRATFGSTANFVGVTLVTTPTSPARLSVHGHVSALRGRGRITSGRRHDWQAQAHGNCPRAMLGLSAQVR